MDDEGIIGLLFRRSEEGIREMEVKFASGCMAIARNILGNEEDARECVNDVWLGAWNTIPPNRPDPLRAFVYRICRNQAVKRFHRERAKKRYCAYDAALEELEDTLAGFESLEDTLSARELGGLLDDFLDTLRERDRELFTRRYWYGDAVAEIAGELDMSPNAASVRLGRIRGKLREFLIREGYEP